jgi:predicted nucleic acid-binding protein
VKVTDALANVQRLFLDTAPGAYFLEQHPRYNATVSVVIDLIDKGSLVGIASAVTLAECLVLPYRTGDTRLIREFLDFFLLGRNMTMVPVDTNRARVAAELRARYNLSLADAFQVATALSARCDVFLTNDGGLRRVHEIRILMVDDLEL